VLLDRIRALKELNIPEKMFEDLLDIFIEQAEQSLIKLDNAIRRRDYPEIRKTAHFLQGSSGNLRIEKIRETARELELDALENRAIAVVEKRIMELRSLFNDVKQEVLNGRV